MCAFLKNVERNSPICYYSVYITESMCHAWPSDLRARTHRRHCSPLSIRAGGRPSSSAALPSPTSWNCVIRVTGQGMRWGKKIPLPELLLGAVLYMGEGNILRSHLGGAKTFKEHDRVTACSINFPLSILAGFNWRAFVCWVGRGILGPETNCLGYWMRSWTLSATLFFKHL